MRACRTHRADSGMLVDSLHRANLDGSDTEELLKDVASWGLAVDSTAEKVYWTDMAAKRISRSNLDGTEAEALITEGLDEPCGLALDAASRHLYWSDFAAGKIQRAPLNNLTALEDLVTNLTHPSGIAVDSHGRKVYWTDRGSFKLQRAGLDGSDVEDVVAQGLKDPTSVAVDAKGDFVYWTTIGTVYEGMKKPSSDALSGGRVQRLRIGAPSLATGAAVEDIVRTGRSRPVALAVIGTPGAGCAQVGTRRLRVGDSVVLRPGLGEADDARRGPLRPGDMGRIAADDKSDQPFMVSVGGQDWWYREDALQLSMPR